MNGYQRAVKTFLGKKCLGNNKKTIMGYKMNGFSGFGDSDNKKSIGKNFKKKIEESKLAKDLKKASAQIGGDLLKLQGYKDTHPKGDVHPQNTPGEKSKLIPGTSPQHKYLYKPTKSKKKKWDRSKHPFTNDWD